MKNKGVRLNGVLLILLIIATVVVNYYLSANLVFENNGPQAILSVYAGVGTGVKFMLWFSALIPILMISVYFGLRRILFRGGSLTAYATNIGVIASVFLFLDGIRMATTNIFMGKMYLTSPVFEKSTIEILFNVMNNYFYYINWVGELFFTLWLLLIGAIMVRTGYFKIILGLVTFFIALFGFVALFIVGVPVLATIYYWLLAIILFIIAIAMLLFGSD